MPVIMHCGFQSVDTSGFRSKSLSKGMKLVNSHHVSNVTETIDSNYRCLQGFVLPETKVHNPRYHVTIELNENREVKTSTCSCKAGQARCKHIAAVCLFANKEDTWSKTNEPLVWNKPSETQSEKYSKGIRLEVLHSGDKSVRPSTDRKITFDFIKNIPETLPDIDCPFFNMIKAERACVVERETMMAEELRKRDELLYVVDALEEFQATLIPYHFYNNVFPSTDCSLLRFKRLLCPEELTEAFRKIQVTDVEWREICIESVSQSQSAMWFRHRYPRITCSKKAHQIKTRRQNLEKLALQFKNQKQIGGGPMTTSMKYGIATEPIARKAFETRNNMKVHEVGLVICKKQPFLACSPDGIIVNESALLEIKCPHTCENVHIVDHTVKKCNISYLYFGGDDKVHLNEKSDYYTQVQTSMYILGLPKCYFFVYSKKDDVTILITRDENFLVELIPKIEMFYINYFLPILK